MTKDTKFKPGRSGNPKGRPKGSKDKRTSCRLLFENESEVLIRKVIELALEGDVTCLKMCIDRIVPSYRSTEPSFSVDDLNGTVTEKTEQIIKIMGVGEITLQYANSMLQAVITQDNLSKNEEIKNQFSDLFPFANS